jgi:hypothetical protein
MSFLFDVICTLVSLVFLGIVGMIAGVAVPGLFMAVAAPWLDWIIPVDRKS